MTIDLAGRRALVTGGGRGIGRAVARALAQAGAHVSITGRDAVRLAEALSSGDAEAFVAADATDEAASLAAIDTLTANGPFDIVVANAGGAETAPFTRTDPAMMRRMLELNLIGTMIPFRAALPGMVARGSGRLIAIASTAGRRGYAYASAYCAAKHAVIGLVRALALETARSGVTVNAVCPGYTDTDLVMAGARQIADKTGATIDEAKTRLAADNPMGRLIRPGEVAAAVLALCGPGMAAVNGQALLVNGGEFG